MTSLLRFVVALVTVICLAGCQCVDLAKWHLTTKHSPHTVEEAVKRYFESRTRALHVRLQSTSAKHWKRVAMQHLTDVLRNSTRLTYLINIENKSLRCNKGNSHNLWYVDSYAALSQILPFKKEHFGGGGQFYVIFLTYPLSADHGRVVQRILAKMFQLQIVNVIVIVKDSADSFVVYSFEVFEEKRCRQVKPVVSNRFSGGRFARSELFPRKLRNFHNCTIRAMGRNIAPFLMYEYRRVPSGIIVQATGVEANMLQLIAKALNFRVVFHSDHAHQWGDVLVNGSIQGPFTLLDNGVVDVLIGYFFCASHRMPYFEESISYMRTTVVAVVKNAAPDENLTWMFDPFQLDTWLMLIALIAMATVATYAANWSLPLLGRLAQRRYRVGSWLDVIGTLASKPCALASSNHAMRFAIALWCGGWVIFNAAYQGKLYDAYNHNDTGRLPTLNDLSKRNYTFLQRHTFNIDTWTSGFVIPKESVTRFHSIEPNSLYETLLNYSGNAAVISTSMRTSFYQRSQRTNKVVAIPETIQVTEFCAYFRHHSYLVEPFNRVISMIRSSGVLKKWVVDQCPNCDLNEEPRLKPELKKHGHYPKPLNAAKFTVVFGAFVALQLIACVVFGFELFFAYLKNTFKSS